jgi:predicted outer membrane repeat protein
MCSFAHRRLARFLATFLFVILSALPAAPAFSGAISVDDDAPGCVNAPGQPDPYSVVYCRIDYAITDASSGDTIHIAPGTYDDILLFNSVKNLTLLGTDELTTIISGRDTFTPVQVLNDTVEIHNVTIRDGSASSIGGGISNNGTLTIYNSRIIENADTNTGGGIFNQGTLTLSGCLVSQNEAGSLGGGIYNIGEMNLYSTDVLDNQVSGADANGGGIFNYGSGVMWIEDSRVDSNDLTTPTTGGYGAGIYNSATMHVYDTSVSSNQSSGTTYGGGIFNMNALTLSGVEVEANLIAEGFGAGIDHSFGSLTIEESTIGSNQILGGGGFGGGLYLAQPAELNNVTIRNNVATSYGGGINSAADVTLRNVTLYGNTAPDGGAIHHTGLSAVLTLSNGTVYNNLTGGGTGTGGIFNYADVLIRNSILAWNVNGNCSNGSGGVITSQGYNIDNLNTCSFSAVGDLPNTNPMLGLPGDYGGPVWTVPLLPGSPALEAGNPATPGSGGSSCEATDARLVTRPIGTRCDMGAFESNYPFSAFLPLIAK